MSSNKPFLVMDCTIRDGGYINNWDFSMHTVKEMYRATAQAGSDVFELGFLGKEDSASLWRNCQPETVLEVRSAQTSANTRISAMLEADTVGMPLGSPKETGIDILRIALNRNKIAESIPRMEAYRKQGYQVFVQLMGITGYQDIEILRVLEQLEECGYVDYVNIGDSYGSLLPERTGQIITLMKNNTKLGVGLHPHNNMQLGMANILAAVNAGADIVDGTMFGMGRGGGNVPLELILAYYGKLYGCFDVLPVLEFIDRHMVLLSKEYDWGYSLPTLLSGVYECHPYYTSKLVEKREYTIQQILKTVQIVSNSNVIGFSDDLLTDIVESGFAKDSELHQRDVAHFVSTHKDKVPYAGRHAGRTILVLVAGTSLKDYQQQIHEYIKKNNPIVLGANNLGGLFVPNYHAFNNQRRFKQYSSTVDATSHLLLGPGVTASKQDFAYEEIICYNSSSTPLEIQGGVITSNCRSIGVLLGAVALVMGADQLVFAGMDGYLGKGATMFYEGDESVHQEDLLAKHEENQNYLNQLFNCAKAMGCVNIKSITPTTYRLEA